MGAFFRFIGAFFQGWKRKVGCVILFLAGLMVSDMLWTLHSLRTGERRIDPPELVPLMIIEESTIISLLIFISAYLLLSNPRSAKSVPRKSKGSAKSQEPDLF